MSEPAFEHKEIVELDSSGTRLEVGGLHGIPTSRGDVMTIQAWLVDGSGVWEMTVKRSNDKVSWVDLESSDAVGDTAGEMTGEIACGSAAWHNVEVTNALANARAMVTVHVRKNTEP